MVQYGFVIFPEIRNFQKNDEGFSPETGGDGKDFRPADCIFRGNKV